jgi:hypothetical protein
MVETDEQLPHSRDAVVLAVAVDVVLVILGFGYEIGPS